jgi:uncharacterized integral membrane protein
MGFKTLTFLIVIIIMSLFFIQNVDSISLVFLGFKSPIFPLSLWIICALFAGIFSSLMIQVLSNNPTIIKTKSNQSFSNNNNNLSDNPPPSPKYNPPLAQIPFVDKPQTEKKSFSPTPIYNKNSVPDNVIDDFDKDFDFDDMPENINQDNQLLEEKNQPNLTTNNIDINPPLEIENIPSPEIILEKELTPSSSEDIPLEKISKPREASIYSYQSKEKTDIKPQLSTPKSNQQKKSLPNNRDNNNQGGVYDAPYRVISPANDSQEDIYNNLEDDDEDWDI